MYGENIPIVYKQHALLIAQIKSLISFWKMNCNKKHWLLLVAIFISSCMHNTDSNSPDGIDITGRWELISYVSDELKKEDVRYIDLPGSIDASLMSRQYATSIVKVKKSIFIGKEFAGEPLVLSLGSVAIFDEVRINGILIGTTGTVPESLNDNYRGFFWKKERNYLIPQTLIRYNEGNCLELTLFYHIVRGTTEHPVLIPYTAWIKQENLITFLLSMFKGGSFLLFAIFIILLPVLTGVKRRKVALYSSLLIIASIVIYALVYGQIPEMAGLFRFKLIISFYVLIAFIFLLMMQSFFNVQYKAIIIFSAIIVFASLASLLIAGDTRELIHHAAPIFLSASILLILFQCIIFIKALVADPRQYGYLTIPVLLILAGAARSYYYIFTFEIHRIPLENLYYIPHILFLGIIVFLFDLRGVRMERDSLARAIIQQSIHASKKSHKSGNAYAPRNRIREVIQHLDENFTSTYNRSEIAKAFNMNEDYLCAIFKKTTGTTISQYINNKRIELAKELLRKTESKVIDIAFHVGFDNLTYFYRLFKQETGCSPNAFRKKKSS